MKIHVLTIIILLHTQALLAEPFATERKILSLSKSWKAKMMALTNYKGLRDFCSDDELRMDIFNQLAEIHHYHDMLENELKSSGYNHSSRTIKRILRHIERLERKYHPEDFADFFSEQCSLQSKIQKNSSHYSAGFGSHSYSGKVYAQEVEMYRYLKGLSKKIEKIKMHVEDFYIGRKVWEN